MTIFWTFNFLLVISASVSSKSTSCRLFCYISSFASKYEYILIILYASKYKRIISTLKNSHNVHSGIHSMRRGIRAAGIFDLNAVRFPFGTLQKLALPILLTFWLFVVIYKSEMTTEKTAEVFFKWVEIFYEDFNPLSVFLSIFSISSVFVFIWLHPLYWIKMHFPHPFHWFSHLCDKHFSLKILLICLILKCFDYLKKL